MTVSSNGSKSVVPLTRPNQTNMHFTSVSFLWQAHLRIDLKQLIVGHQFLQVEENNAFY
ncbi:MULTISPECIES: hypothetical protein [unclassified Paenibacillus]|uniref:hypothetical protein n=1 Tax=unclassified Paenibacillus TaxID=185978 RepID=UPI0036354084